jgi:hypothetical protein
MPKSARHHAAARRRGVTLPASQRYEIIDGSHTAKDLGGVAVALESGKKYVLLTPNQAKWWLDHGVIVLATT